MIFSNNINFSYFINFIIDFIITGYKPIINHMSLISNFLLTSVAFAKGILTFTPVSRNRPRIIKLDRITLFRVYATSEKMFESRNSIAHLQHVGISALSATSEWHIISKQRSGILLITRNHCVIIIRQNLKLFSPAAPFHPRVPVVSFNSPWLTSLLSRILNARLKHLRVGFCNIYNARIIGSY